MARTIEESQQDTDEFVAAFEEGETQAEPETKEDDAEAMVDGADAAPAVVIAIEEPVVEAPVAEDPAAQAPAQKPGLTPEEQAQRSWEGRLKAREAELKAKDAELKAREEALNKPPMEAMEPDETPAEDAAEPAITEAIEEVAEQVQSGELTIDQAMTALSNDFGPDFTKMLSMLIESKAAEIAGKTADERFSPMKQDMDELVTMIVDDKAKSHTESIAGAHADFADIARSPEFHAYIENMDEAMQAQAMNTIETGSARQIISLLDSYKKTLGKVDPDPAMDAAEGVRSKSSLKIPEKPTESEDYEDAWNSY